MKRTQIKTRKAHYPEIQKTKDYLPLPPTTPLPFPPPRIFHRDKIAFGTEL